MSNCELRIGLGFGPQIAIRNSKSSLGGLSVLISNLFLDLPVCEWILVTASWTMPGTFYRICATFMKHFYNQMTMKAHRRMAMNHLFFCGFVHYCHFFYTLLTVCKGCPILRANINSNGNRLTDYYSPMGLNHVSLSAITDV